MAMLNNWKTLAAISLLFLAVIIIIFFITGLWVLLSLGVGFLFGFALQKGDLCGASAMSEVILMKDKNKIFGLLAAIVTSMAGFAILESLGLIQLAPKKLIWLSAIVGGLIFGAGTVLGGGCVSGCLYKGAAGNINSIGALLTIPVGILLVDSGPLSGLHKFFQSFVFDSAGGKPVTLNSMLGVPFWALAAVITAITVVFGYKFLKRQKNPNITQTGGDGIGRVFTKSWKPWQAGIAIGIIGMIAWLVSIPTGRNYPLGVTHGVSNAYYALVDSKVKFVYEKPEPAASEKAINPASQPPREIQPAKAEKPAEKKIVVWLILLVIGLVIGSHMSARMSGQAKLLPKPPGETLTAMLGGLLIGIGAGFGTGCVIGNIISGWAMLSIGTFIFGVATLAGNWIATYFYLMGGSLKS